MDRGVVPLSAFVEVYIEVQDVNDNAPQTSEPVYYPSVMENSPKDVSIIQMNAIDPDDKGSNSLTYRITSGNPQGFFAINTITGKILCIAFLVIMNGIFTSGSTSIGSWAQIVYYSNANFECSAGLSGFC